MNKVELEERLVQFAVKIIEIINELPTSKAGNHISSQLLRSGTSPALNYAESRSAESMKDFIHKLQIVLKELRESHVCLRIIYNSKLYDREQTIILALKECDELISIFVKSVQTASKSKLKQK